MPRTRGKRALPLVSERKVCAAFPDARQEGNQQPAGSRDRGPCCLVGPLSQEELRVPLRAPGDGWIWRRLRLISRGAKRQAKSDLAGSELLIRETSKMS